MTPTDHSTDDAPTASGETPKVYVFVLSRWGDDFAGACITEDGEEIGRHVSSSMDWLVSDLTRRGDRKRALEDKYPNGYRVIVADPPDEIAALAGFARTNDAARTGAPDAETDGGTR